MGQFPVLTGLLPTLAETISHLPANVPRIGGEDRSRPWQEGRFLHAQICKSRLHGM